MLVKSRSFAAFISYKRVSQDTQWAEWLQRSIERYRVPRATMREEGVPRRIGLVFRDDTELRPGASLEGSILLALQKSRALIVVGSPRAAGSWWIEREIDAFRAGSPGRPIIPVLVEGASLEAFPSSIFVSPDASASGDAGRSLEPLVADMRPGGGSRRGERKRLALIGVIATILGVDLDALIDRERRRRRLRIRTAVAMVLVMGFASYLALNEIELRTSIAEVKNIVATVRRDPGMDPVHAAAALREVPDALGEQSVVVEALKVLDRNPALLVIQHQDWVESACFSPDGATVLTASKDGTARLTRLDGQRGPVVLDCGVWVRAAIFSVDGTRIATGSDDGVRLWSVSDLESFGSGAGSESSGVPRLGGHGARTNRVSAHSVTHLAFSPDGDHLLGVAGEGILVWDLEDTESPTLLSEPLAQQASWSPDGRRVVAGSFDGAVRVWDIDRPDEPMVREAQRSQISSAFFTSDGRHLVTASNDQSVHVWSADGGGCSMVLSDHKRGVNSADYSPTTGRVVTASSDGTVRIWDPWNSENSQVITNYGRTMLPEQSRRGDAALSVAFHPNGLDVASTSLRGRVRLYNGSGMGPPSSTFVGHMGAVGTVSFDPTGDLMVTTSEDGTARVWRTTGAAEPQWIASAYRWVECVAASSDGTYVATGDSDGSIRLYRLEPGVEPVEPVTHDQRVHAVALSSNGRYVLGGFHGGTVLLLDTSTASAPVTLSATGEEVTFLGLGRDGEVAIAARLNGEVSVWDTAAPSEPRVILRHPMPVVCGAVSTDGEYAAFGQYDGAIHVWRLSAPGRPTVLAGHTDRVHSLTFHPSSHFLISASADHTACAWSLTEKRSPIVLRGHTSEVLFATFDNGGRQVVTTSEDGSVLVWDLREAMDPLVLAEHTDRVTFAAFDEAGDRLVTASDDGTARVWKLDGSEEAIVLRHGGDVLHAHFTDAGRRVMTATDGARVRSWLLDWPLLRRALSNRMGQ